MGHEASLMKEALRHKKRSHLTSETFSLHDTFFTFSEFLCFPLSDTDHISKPETLQT